MMVRCVRVARTEGCRRLSLRMLVTFEVMYCRDTFIDTHNIALSLRNIVILGHFVS